ncbi:hypothetical protein V6N13_012580 [Hibiscus sabdariffa]
MSVSASSSSSPSEQQSSNSSNIDGNLVDRVRLAEVKYNDPVEFDSDSDDGSRITEEEARLYCAAVKASDGFDVPNLPEVIACCVSKPYRMTDYSREDLHPFCVAGMKHYNQDKVSGMNRVYGMEHSVFVGNFSDQHNIDGNLVDGVRLAEVKNNPPGEYMSDSDDGSRITEEDKRLYAAAVEASEGFDVPDLPGVIACCPFKPCRVTGYFGEDLSLYCVAGMKHYNQDKKTNYEFVRLVKANYRHARGILYYVTFEGRTPENNTKIFEAQVLNGIAGDNEKIKVYFCREKAPLTKSGYAEGSSGN